MFVTDDMIAQMVREYGVPAVREFNFPAIPTEMARIRSSQKDGRNHDVTLYIEKGDRLFVIAKHPYPPGLYRTPSGGIHPGETIIDGINREAHEETGCTIELNSFLLRTSVIFRSTENPTDTIFWRSFVFRATYLSGDMKYTDHDEISDLRLADWSEFPRFGQIMRQTDSAGLHYRAALHEAVAALLGRRKHFT